MKRLAKTLAAVAFLLIFSSGTALAWTTEWVGRETRIFGVGGTVSYPTGSYDNRVEPGYGLCALLDYPFIPLLDITADVGWTHFAGENGNPDVDVWNFTLGSRVALGAFFMGGETGYYSKLDEWGWVPSIGLRFGQFESSVRIKAAGSNQYSILRVGYYF